MQNVKNKKLLVLGGNPNELSLVSRAQELGVYVIVADYHTDWTLSPAKKIANEAWNVSWSDIDTLEKRCLEARVDGVMAGYSEIRVDCMIQLCKRLGLPCYINEDQLAITRDKIKFKEACRRSGVPVVKEYASTAEVTQFPVIVKPVDRAGSIGITVATNPEELEQAYQYAMEMSICKKVIIEDFISNGVKFDAYYQIANGEIVLLPGSDVIFAKDNGLERVVQSAWLMPSIYQKWFVEKVDPSMQRMLRDMNIRDGYIFFSGFALPQGEFVFFECGFRLCGGYFYKYFEDIGGWNTLDLLICHALTGSTENLPKKKDPNLQLKNVTINLYAKKGVISGMEGLEQIVSMPDHSHSVLTSYIGERCKDDTAILSKICLVHFTNESAEKLSEDVRKLYETISVTDEHGQDMIYDRVDPDAILHWWD